MPTVFPEDLIDVVIAADAVRRRELGMSPARFRPSQRTRVEPFFNALGWLWGSALRLLPLSLRNSLDLWLCQKMGGHAVEENPELPKRIQQSVDLARQLYQKTGQWPAVMILTSHPATEGPLAWLRFELLRQGLYISDALVDAARSQQIPTSHGECFLAIDPYALDTVSPAVGGFYAAWMNRTYLAWDRQPSTQSWSQRLLFLRRSGYRTIGWRLFRRLRENVPVLMVLSGGLPHNARLLYAAREFIQSLPLKRWPIRKIVAEKTFMEMLMHPVNGVRPTERGELSVAVLEQIRAYVTSLGLDHSLVESTLQRFQAEFRLETPHRDRLFRILRQRFVAKGKPVLLIAVSHRLSFPFVQIAEPCDLASVEGSFVDGRFK